MDALRPRSRGRVDAALRRPLPAQHLPLRLRRLGQEGVGGALHRQREHRVDVRGQHEPPVGRPLRQAARRRGPVGQAVRQLAHRLVQGPRHDGAGLGGQADDGRRRADRRGRLRLDRRHLGRARPPTAPRPASRRWCCCRADKVSIAQLVQPLANGALVLSLDTDFDGCMAVVQEITKEKRIYLANSMNSLRIEGQKTVAIEIVQQFDWEVPDWIVIPGGNLGNVQRARAGLPDDARARADPAAAAHLPSRRRSAPTRSTARILNDFKTLRADAGAEDAGQRHPDRQPGERQARRSARCSSFNGVVEQATEQELADEAARADRTGMFNCPHTGVALAALRKLVERKVIRSERARGGDLDRATGSSSPTRRRPITWARSRASKPSLPRTRPVELPADAKRGRPDHRAPRREGARCWCPDGRPSGAGAGGSVAEAASARARSRCTGASRGRSRRTRSPTPIVQTATYTFADTAGAEGPLRRQASSATSTGATATRPSASRSPSWPRSRAPRTACSSRSGMARDDHDALRDALARHPRGGHRRQLPAHPPVPEPDPRAATGSRCRRCRPATTRRSRTRSARRPACSSASRRPTRTTASSTSSASPTSAAAIASRR